MNMYRLESSQGEVYYVVAPNWTAAWMSYSSTTPQLTS
jgi:hypothetical protein